MKAIVYERYGSPDELRLAEVARPEPGPGEVRVAVRAASLNSWDWDKLTGRPLLARLPGLFNPAHRVLGCDVAGVVDAVGVGVRDFAVGDEVFGDLSGGAWGGFAEWVAAPTASLARKPPSLGFEQAAALPQAGVIALQALRDEGALAAGQEVLINGAGGGVGTLGLQWAKAQGATVTVVDRGDKLAMLRELGADRTIDYAQEDFTQAGRRYDLVVDVVAQHSIVAYRRVLSEGGTLVVVGGRPAVVSSILLFGSTLGLSRQRLRVLFHRPNRADLELLAQLVVEGTLEPVIERTYPLAQAAEAFRRLGAGLARGKLVILP
ncbi:MAG: NAD(P)-dependent alcohol dehydrogenase [Polyangiaceae bacterium]